MNRRLAALAMAGVFALSLTGCSSNSAGEGEQEIVLPKPTEQSGGSIFGESILSAPENVTLYYVSGDGTSFSAVSRSLTGSSTSDLCEQVVRALLDDSAPERASSVPEGTALLGVEAASGVATVNLSLEAYRASDEQELLKLAASITNSLLSLNEIHGVSVLVAGRALGVASLPLGVRTRSFEGITPAYAQMNVEKEYFLDSDTGTVSRTAALYFPTRDGWLTSETREISFDSSDYASALIRELRIGPLLRSCALSAIPEDVDLLVNNPQIAVTSAGERVLELDFSGALRDYLTFVGLDEWELAGSLTLTLTSFVPEIDAVRLYIGGAPLTQCAMDDRTLVFSDGLLRRSDFLSRVGGTAILYLPEDDGTLRRMEIADSLGRTASPSSVLTRLLDALSAADEVYSGLNGGDLLGVSVENGVASVNFTSDFYRIAQGFSETQERGAVFAVVNTLCELAGIHGVRIYAEGISPETLSGTIYLRGMLLPNPGAVVEATETP